METLLLGRTNARVSTTWLKPSVVGQPQEDGLRSLVESCLASGVPLDLTTAPALWGGFLRGTDAFLTVAGNRDIEHAYDDRHAADLVSAHLLESLSAIGREHWDVYFLRIRTAIEEFQISGALEALEMARQEGHIRFLGLCCDGPAYASLAAWQFHDAFEVLMVPDNESYEVLSGMANSRRVGIVCDGFEHERCVRLATVGTVQDVERALA
jgi:hypothetical protein